MWLEPVFATVAKELRRISGVHEALFCDGASRMPESVIDEILQLRLIK